MNHREENESIYSDLYKDLHGVRPPLQRFRAMSDKEQAAAIDRVAEDLKREIEQDLADDDYPEDYPDDVSVWDEGLIGGDSDLWNEW